jgi:hypothetical protein
VNCSPIVAVLMAGAIDMHSRFRSMAIYIL